MDQWTKYQKHKYNQTDTKALNSSRILWIAEAIFRYQKLIEMIREKVPWSRRLVWKDNTKII